MSKLYFLTSNIITYGDLLDKISQYEIGSWIAVDCSEYNLNKGLYERAVKAGYLMHKITISLFSYTFIVIDRPTKYYGEEYINSYFG